MVKRILEFIFWAGLLGFICLVDETSIAVQFAWLLATLAAGSLLIMLF
jgi:hypothetical protein